MKSHRRRKFAAKRRLLAAVGAARPTARALPFNLGDRIECDPAPATPTAAASWGVSGEDGVELDTVAYDPAMTVNDGEPTDDAFMHEWWVGRLNTGMVLIDGYARVERARDDASAVCSMVMCRGQFRAAA